MTASASTMASATATTALATTSAATAKVTARTGFWRTSLRHGDRTSVKGLAVQILDRTLAFFGRAHRHEAKATRTLGDAIQDEMSIRHGTDASEEFFELPFRGLEGQITYIQFHILFIWIDAVRFRLSEHGSWLGETCACRQVTKIQTGR